MRTRILLAAAAFAATASTGGAAAAHTGSPPAEAPWEAPPAPAASEVVLPTGETVGIAADGALDLSDGRAFSVTRTAEGDRLVVPLDALDEVAAGEWDAAAFNVDSPGAAAVEDEPEAPANVTLTGLWSDGTGADTVVVSWVDLATGEGDGPVYADGKITELTLDPGRYHLVVMLHKTDGEGLVDTIASVQEVRVGRRHRDVLVDGAKAVPLGFDLDRDTVRHGVMLDLFSYPQDAQWGDSAWVGLWEMPGGDLAAIPTGRLSGGHDVGYALREGRSSPEDAAEAYGYNLFRAETQGLRGDLSPAVHDEDLARIDAEYQALGAPGVFNRQDLGDHPDFDAWAYSPTGEVALPSSRTEFYTAGEGLSWEHRAWFPYEGGIRSPWDLVHHRSGVLEAGSVQEMTWNNAPLSVGVDNIGQTWPPAAVSRWDDTGGIYAEPWLFSTAGRGEGLHSEYHLGESRLIQDGEVLAASDVIGVGVDVAAVAAGPLTLTVSADRAATWTPLGTHSEAAWTFDYDPVGNPILPVSVVSFTAPGVVDGAAEGGTVLDATLEYATQPGADDQECTAMAFAVSFDDGATWTDVAIDREGDLASAAVAIPEGAAFASVRFTAADANGNTVAHETIRSFAIV